MDSRGWDIGTRVAVLETEVNELKKDLSAMRKAFYTLAISIAGSAIVFAFSVLLLIGKH